MLKTLITVRKRIRDNAFLFFQRHHRTITFDTLDDAPVITQPTYYRAHTYKPEAWEVEAALDAYAVNKGVDRESLKASVNLLIKY